MFYLRLNIRKMCVLHKMTDIPAFKAYLVKTTQRKISVLRNDPFNASKFVV